MRNLEVIAPAIAAAVRACNGLAITQEAAKAAMATIAKASQPDDMAENLSVFLNLASLNQDLERAGIIRRERTLSALQVAVKAAMAAPASA